MSARAAWRSDSLRTFAATPCRVPLQRLDPRRRQALPGRLPLADQRQIVELDGWAGHKTRTAFREDRARDRRLRVAGYGVTRLTWNQLEDEPESVAADLRALLKK